jgi:FkbM family methyltransferase
MGFFSGKVNGLIKNARLAIDDVRQTWIDSFGTSGEPPSPKVPAGQFKNGIVVVTPNEVNDRHGTGVIISRVFQGVPNILSIRSTDLHGINSLGDFAIRFDHQNLPRDKSFLRLLRCLEGNSFGYVVCVPYEPDDLLTALVLKEAFDAKLCVYVMDDNHLETGRIPADLMEETLRKADLRLAISPEMRDGYENKYRLKFWLRPPVATPAAISRTPHIPSEEVLQKARGIVVGSLWSTQSLNRLARTVSEAGLQVEWFGNSDASWLNFDINDLAAKGVLVRGFIPEPELAEKIKQYAYAIVPSGTLEPDDQRVDIARYSLPTRMPFLLAVGNIPTIVLGSPETAAAGFVDRFGLGEVIPYSGNRLRSAVNRLCLSTTQHEIRTRAAAVAGEFSAEGVWNWMVRAMEQGQPDDITMERLMPRRVSDFAYYLDSPVPPGTVEDFVPVYHGLARLKQSGFEPDFVIDVGASTGIWSVSVSNLFPQARYLLIEPLIEGYGERIGYLKKTLPGAEVVGVAIGDHVGTAQFQISSDLYGSSLLKQLDQPDAEKKEVPLLTLDKLASEKKVKGRGLLKIDVQQAEHLVLAGASEILNQIDVVAAELSLYRLAEGGKTILEMLEVFSEKGFRYFDDVGEWRDPRDGTLLQKDILFVREGLFERCQSKES